jgi:hypothetical protein
MIDRLSEKCELVCAVFDVLSKHCAATDDPRQAISDSLFALSVAAGYMLTSPGTTDALRLAFMRTVEVQIEGRKQSNYESGFADFVSH